MLSKQPLDLLSAAKQNYLPWSKKFETYAAIKGYSHHLTFDSFNDYFASKYQPSDREVRYNQQLAEIKLKALDSKKETIEINMLEDRYHSDLTIWSNDKIKMKRDWTTNQDKISGLLRGSVEEQYWTNIKHLPTIQQMWNQLKKETQQDQAGNFMALLIQFFTARIRPGESLSTYTARVQAVADQTTDLGHNLLTPVLICFFILATIPTRYEQIQQAIFQLPTKEITLDLLKSKFAAEDSRQQAQKLQTNNDTSKIEEACTAINEERKCTICNNLVPSTRPAYHLRCSKKCQDKFREQENAEKSNKSKSAKTKTESANTVVKLF